MPSSFSPTTCVSELRTLEDQLEAALASLTLTINDCSTTNIDSLPQRSSGSSACSSGLGDEIPNDTLTIYNNLPNQQTTATTTTSTTTLSFTSKLLQTHTTDDCDSAFSDSGSTDKVTSPTHDESVSFCFSQNKNDELRQCVSYVSFNAKTVHFFDKETYSSENMQM